jgi:hypothetical protein
VAINFWPGLALTKSKYLNGLPSFLDNLSVRVSNNSSSYGFKLKKALFDSRKARLKAQAPMKNWPQSKQTQFFNDFPDYDKLKMVDKEGMIRAWGGLANRDSWVRKNTDLLQKLSDKPDSYIAGVNGLYSPSAMKLPPNLRPPNSPPGSYNGIEYDKFGFPKLEPHVSGNSHVVKIVMDGSNNDYIKAYNELKNIVGEGNIQFTNSFGSSFKIRNNGQWSQPYTWHHHQDGESMMPVLQTIHQSIQNYHTGGRSISNRGLKGLFDPPQLE